MPIITLTCCPVCGSTQLEKAFDAIDYFSSGEAFPVSECSHCGFRFTNNVPDEEHIGKYYDSPEYISHSDTKKGITNKLYHFFRKRMLRRKVNIVARHISGKPVRLLDVGCGTGYFIQAAQQKGWKVSGIEKDEKARQSASLRSGVDVKDNNALWSMEQSSYDVITLWHVLEHLEKLNETISKINEILSPKGTVVIALPNCSSYDAHFYKEQWAAYDIPRHLWHFTPVTVEKILAKHGLRVIKKIRMPLDAFYISMLSEKYKGSTTLAQFVRACLIGTIGFLKSLSDIGQSSSIIYIVKKRTDGI